MKEKLFIAAILLLCLIPAVGTLLPRTEAAGGNEVLAQPPALRDAGGNLNTGYLPQLSDYVEDNYFLRQRLVSAWSSLNQHILHTSIADNVVLGRDGWLYFGDTLDDYTGAEVMTDREIFCAARNLALIDEFCSRQDAQFLFTIAPNKNSVYPEHMPDLTVSGQPHNAQRLMEALDRQEVAYADLFSAFRRQEETLYFTQDSHWNSKGAALAADTILDTYYTYSNFFMMLTSSIRQSDLHLYNSLHPAYFDGSFTPEANHLSDLYAMLYPTGQWLETDQTYSGELSFAYETPFRSANDLTIATSGGRLEESLVMYRDSFGILLYPYMADSFQNALFSRSVPYKLDLAAQQDADFVVIELVERNLDYLIQNAPVMPAMECDNLMDATPFDRFAVSPEPEAAQSLPGYALVKGTLPGEPDVDSPVYFCMNGRCFEAFLLENNAFALYVQEDELNENKENLSVVFTALDETVSVPASASN